MRNILLCLNFCVLRMSSILNRLRVKKAEDLIVVSKKEVYTCLYNLIIYVNYFVFF